MRNFGARSVLKTGIESKPTIGLLVAGFLSVGAGGRPALGATVGAGGHPFQAIVPQNVFRLRAEPEVAPPSPIRDLPPTSRALSIRVTGFTDVCGRSQVLLEISEQGKAVERAILAPGDRYLGVEVEWIDVKGMRALLSVNGKLGEVTLQEASTPPPIPPLKHLRK